jgi:hypothetical protein
MNRAYVRIDTLMVFSVMKMLLAYLFLMNVMQMRVSAFAVLSMGSAVEKSGVIAVVGATGQLDCSAS